MSDYTLSKIYPSDTKTMAQLHQLLENERIRLDTHLDYTCGLFTENGNLVATGSYFKNTLRCIAIDSNYRGEGLMNQIISHLIQLLYDQGEYHLFVYTKPDTAKYFTNLGFYTIASVDNLLVFLENRKAGFSNYLKSLQTETEQQLTGTCIAPTTGVHLNAMSKFSVSNDIEIPNLSNSARSIAAIVLNANPFTNSHLQLIEQSAKENELLHLFVVSEDVSIFPFSIRNELVKQGTKHIKNIVYHETGPYIISSATFPSYFQQDDASVTESQVQLDLMVFTKIAEALHINHRYIGSEPFSQVTNIYNNQMQRLLPNHGITCHIIERFTTDAEEIISASSVRQYLKNDCFDALATFVPPTTLAFLESPEAEPIIQKCKEIANVIHH